ncbi:hypothetical protein PT2222_140295 [Paraburkholderia tropica]
MCFLFFARQFFLHIKQFMVEMLSLFFSQCHVYPLLFFSVPSFEY